MNYLKVFWSTTRINVEFIFSIFLVDLFFILSGIGTASSTNDSKPYVIEGNTMMKTFEEAVKTLLK